MALFFCRRRVKEPVRPQSQRFTIGEVDPFFTVECGDDAPTPGAVAVVIGVALQNTDGRWGVHELSDDADVKRRLRPGASQEMAESLKSRAVLEAKKRLVDALNRLKEHYGRIYVYQRP